MIAQYRSEQAVFARAVELITRSGAATDIEALNAARRGVGGRPARGIKYTLTAVLVALTCLIDRRTTPSLKAVLEEIVFRFDDHNLEQVGMQISHAERRAITGKEPWEREYSRFWAWLQRQVTVLDSEFDQPARRISNAQDARRRASRTSEEEERARQAKDDCRRICNRLVAASVRDPRPDGYVGDIVVDETIFDVAQTSEGTGGKPDSNRSAVSAAPLYVRAGGVAATAASSKHKKADKVAFGIGVTAIIRVGKPSALRAVVPLITAIDIHRSTGDTLSGLRNALDMHARNGFDPRHSDSRRRRWPYLTVDMGYNPRDGFAELLVERQYSMLATYPKQFHLVHQAEDPVARDRLSRQEPGPIVGHGDIYCPAAANQLTKPMVFRMRDQPADRIAAHDNRLRQVLPLLMGTNSRIKTAAPTAGRPKAGEPRDVTFKMDVVCPAVQGRVRCPLKPMSLHANPSQVPTLDPDWEASEYRCCEKSQTTITFTPKQLKLYQGGLTPGSWEHILHFEAYRSMNERQFSILKSPHVTGMSKINYGPRREPLLKILLSLAVAVSNLRVQDDPRVREVDSVAERFQKLERNLGRPPARTPNRT